MSADAANASVCATASNASCRRCVAHALLRAAPTLMGALVPQMHEKCSLAPGGWVTCLLRFKHARELCNAGGLLSGGGGDFPRRGWCMWGKVSEVAVSSIARRSF